MFDLSLVGPEGVHEFLMAKERVAGVTTSTGYLARLSCRGIPMDKPREREDVCRLLSELVQAYLIFFFFR